MLEKAQRKLHNNNKARLYNNNRAIKRGSLATAAAGLPSHPGTGFCHFLCRLEGITTSLFSAGKLTTGPPIETEQD